MYYLSELSLFGLVFGVCAVISPFAEHTMLSIYGINELFVFYAILSL